MKFRFLMLSLIDGFDTAYTVPIRAQVSDQLIIAKGKSILLGWAGDQSLQVVKASTGTLDGPRMAVKAQNDAGGIDGFKLQVVPKDDQHLADTAAIAAQPFVAQGDIAGTVGHLRSRAHQAPAATH